MPTETAVKRACLAYLEKVPGAFAFSTPASRYGRAGVADITAVIDGRAVYIECKTPVAFAKRDHGQTHVQRAFAEKVRAAGGAYLLVDSVEELESGLNEVW